MGGGGGGGGGLVPENACKSQKIKSIVPDLSEKIMACMIEGDKPNIAEIILTLFSVQNLWEIAL